MSEDEITTKISDALTDLETLVPMMKDAKRLYDQFSNWHRTATPVWDESMLRNRQAMNDLCQQQDQVYSRLYEAVEYAKQRTKRSFYEGRSVLVPSVMADSCGVR